MGKVVGVYSSCPFIRRGIVGRELVIFGGRRRFGGCGICVGLCRRSKVVKLYEVEELLIESIYYLFSLESRCYTPLFSFLRYEWLFLLR